MGGIGSETLIRIEIEDLLGTGVGALSKIGRVLAVIITEILVGSRTGAGALRT